MYLLSLLFSLEPLDCKAFTVVAVREPRQAIIRFQSDGEDDLFEYFDPLLSPHAYPNGIGKAPDQKPIAPTDEDRYDPLQLSIFGQGRSSPATNPPDIDTDSVFDPTISPHEYAKGTPDTIIGDEPVEAPSLTVGILLMDHGSRSAASNQRLHDLARLYEQSVGSSRVIVRAAHMEIASPSIEEGLEALLSQGVDEIVCHPYFLSPGRHVGEDIPRLVAAAVDKLEIDIPVVTTAPVGSSTDVMIRAIDSLVSETSSIFDQARKGGR